MPGAPLIIVDVALGEGHRTQALIDSEARVSMIKVSCIPSSTAMSSLMHEIAGLGGVPQAFGSVEILLNVAGLRPISCKILMVPDTSIMYPIILSNDVLTNEMITVDLLNGKLSQPLITGCCDIYLGNVILDQTSFIIRYHSIQLKIFGSQRVTLSWFLFVSRRLRNVILL